MKSILYAFFGAFGVLIAPFRRIRKPQAPARMDAATYAAMVAEAERIASPYKIAGQRAAAAPPVEELGGDFPDVDALLERAGIMV